MMGVFDRLDRTMKKDHERQAKSGTSFYRFPKGKTRFRILPAAPGDDEGSWFIPVGYHYNIPGQKAPLICRGETHYANEDCPVCALVNEMRGDGRNDEAQKISLRRRRLVRAVIRDEEDKGAQILDLPVSVFMTIGETMQNTEDFGQVLHIQKGRDFILNKDGEGINTKYQIQAHPKTCAVLPGKDATLTLIKKLKPIDDLVSLPAEEDINKALFAQADDDDADASFGSSADSDDDTDDDTWEEGGDDTEDETEEEDAVGDDVPSDDDSSDEEDSDDVIDDDDEDDTAWMDGDDDDDGFEDDEPKETVAQVRKKMKAKAAAKTASAAKGKTTQKATSRRKKTA
jgi:hypothetical protein